MKRLIKTLFIVLAIAGTLGLGQKETVKAGSLDVRGIWVSCFEYETVGLSNKTESEFRVNANRLFYQLKANGCNTVYFHVRAYDDAIYPSDIVGWSERISTGGKALSYDPLKLLVYYAHKHGLKFHAWMNPYRVTPEKVLNPAKAATTNRIVAQVKEIINNYDVDGIHFDDYFYPTNEKKYNKVSKAKKKENVNAMVKAVYQAVKEKNKKLQFGISPAGTTDYCAKIGADIETWMSQPGYVDYIIPQIYWSDNYIMEGKKTKLFKERLAEWRSLNTLDIPMYIGIALYKAGSVLKEDLGWYKSSNNIAKQLSQIKSGNSEGYVLFSYTNLYHSDGAKEIKNYLQKIGTLKINKKKKTLRVGKKFKLQATAWPLRVANNVKWKSSNKKIATVTKNGRVKAKKKGKVKIYAYYGNLKKVCKITVKAKKK